MNFFHEGTRRGTKEFDRIYKMNKMILRMK